jgi:amino acid adenylation domain-containing protein
MDEYEARAAQLSPTKRRLLEMLRERAAAAAAAGGSSGAGRSGNGSSGSGGNGAGGPAVAPLTPRPRDTARLPLSVIQEQLWFLDQVAPGQPTYNVVTASVLRGALDVAALRAALDALVARHEALRTVFAVDAAGAPHQVVLDPAPASLILDSVTDRPAAARTEAARRIVLDQEVHGLFDLARGPLLRARLIAIDDDHHMLSLAAHHIAVDGWSISLVAAELAELYDAHHAGRAPRLAPVALHYPDYALWQREHYLRGPDVDRHLDYWATRLAQAPVIDLPADRPRPPVVSFRGAYARHEFSPALKPALARLSRSTGRSTLMLVLAGFSAVLTRYTAAEDIVIGTAVPGRTRPEFESMVGCFTNFVVLRADTSGDPSFTELAARVGDDLLGAWEHQDAPFEKVVERLKITRDTGRNPVFTACMQLLDQSTGGGTFTLPGLTAEPVDLRLNRSRFDLSASAIDDGDSFYLLMEYSTDLFEEARLLRLARHLERVLLAVAERPELTVSTLPMLDDAERAHVLALAEGPRREFRRAGLHVLVAEQAARTPDAVAVVADGTQTSYRELDARAEALADRLAGLGVGTGSVVAIALERGLDALVSMLGVFKAGAAYLPIDPGYPPRRLAQVLDDARCALVLTHSHLVENLRLTSTPDRRTLCLDEEPPGTGAEPATGTVARTVARPAADPDTLAYVLYTSGSTGTPKGVPIEHGMVCAFSDWMIEYMGFWPGARALHASTLTFDTSVAEIFNTFISGATLVVCSRDDVVLPGRLADLVRRERITHLFATPAVLKLVKPDDYPDLRAVIVGGEVCTADLVESWRVPGRRFFNVYGPTETTIGCIAFDCTQWTRAEDPPIGRPLGNRRATLVDRWLNPVPVGIPGEILLGGEGVSRGYLNSPELSAAKFIDDPFHPGQRVYRSGDLAYWTEDGQLRFLGRNDTQIKLRGLRIELGDIEASLGRNPGVAQAVAAVRADAPGGPRLVAYVVPTVPGAVTIEDLRAQVAADLPTYMVPSTFMLIDAIPLSLAGKVDRSRLPVPDLAGVTAEFTAPRTETEERVAGIFADVLGLPRVGAHDDFFALGGHSLQAARVLAQLGAATGATLPMATFYQASSVAAVAEALGDRGGSTQGCVVPLKASGARTPVFMPHAISGSPYSYADLARSIDIDQPVYGFEAPGLEGDDAPVEGVVSLAARYIDDLRRVRPHGPYLLAGWSMGGFIAFEMSRQLVAAGEEVALTVMIDSDAPGPVEPPDELETLQRFSNELASVAGATGDGRPRVLEALAALDPADRPARLVTLLVEAGLVPADVRPRYIQQRFEVFRANLRSLYLYQPRLYPGRLTLIKARESRDSGEAWARYAAGGVERVEVPGNHYSMWKAPHLAMLVGTLETAIATATRT